MPIAFVKASTPSNAWLKYGLFRLSGVAIWRWYTTFHGQPVPLSYHSSLKCPFYCRSRCSSYGCLWSVIALGIFFVCWFWIALNRCLDLIYLISRLATSVAGCDAARQWNTMLGYWRRSSKPGGGSQPMTCTMYKHRPPQVTKLTDYLT